LPVQGPGRNRKLGSARIAGQVEVPASTVYRVLVRHGMNQLAWMDRPTGRVIRRYEHDHPGDLVHIDTKKLRQRFTQRYRPQTNGKDERFNRTLLDEWAYVRAYRSEAERRRALDNWLHLYNHRRSHTALNGQPPRSRDNNVPAHYT
jgi:transposase InsO family protein